MRTKLTPAEIRKDAARLARIWSRCAAETGNIECANEFRDFAGRLERIRLTRD